MSQKANERLRDVTLWYMEHARDSMDVPKRQEFLETAFRNLLDVMVDFAEDITRLEGRPPESLGRRLWTPNGMRLSGDLTRFG